MPYLIPALDGEAIPICYTRLADYLTDRALEIAGHSDLGLVPAVVPCAVGYVEKCVAKGGAHGLGNRVHRLLPAQG